MFRKEGVAGLLWGFCLFWVSPNEGENTAAKEMNLGREQMNSQKEGNICLALILFMLHLAARATAKFLTVLPGYLHLNHFS